MHARASPQTEDLFDAQRFAAMKPGAWFVNTARETMVEEDALLEALRSGRLRGAALDVVRPSPDGRRTPLLDEPGVVLLPHIGGATHETLARGAQMIVEDLARIDAGQAALHVINAAAVEPPA